jgi:hypothetical protein
MTPKSGSAEAASSPPKDARALADEYAADFLRKFPSAVVDQQHLAAWFHSMMGIGADMIRPVRRKTFRHGVDCLKVTHVGGGYLHGAEDDRAYEDV